MPPPENTSATNSPVQVEPITRPSRGGGAIRCGHPPPARGTGAIRPGSAPEDRVARTGKARRPVPGLRVSDDPLLGLHPSLDVQEAKAPALAIRCFEPLGIGKWPPEKSDSRPQQTQPHDRPAEHGRKVISQPTAAAKDGRDRPCGFVRPESGTSATHQRGSGPPRSTISSRTPGSAVSGRGSSKLAIRFSRGNRDLQRSLRRAWPAGPSHPPQEPTRPPETTGQGAETLPGAGCAGTISVIPSANSVGSPRNL